MSIFPTYRPRRLRRTEALRSASRETVVSPADLILPLFAVPGTGVRRPVGSMAGVEQTSADELLRDAEEALRLGIGGVLLFGIPEHKDELGTGGYDEDGIVQRAVRLLKRELPELLVITDVCLCEYTSHGHCGILRAGDVDNDATLPLLARVAATHAAAGADVVAPSDMMDGRVGALRKALDAGGFEQTAILSYAVKYASAFYGPFRDAAESAPSEGDRRSAQMDPGNVREALREARQDVAEGADMLMVKPALSYLDVIHRVKEDTGYPVFAYHVSGEYAMIEAAAQRGWIDGPRAHEEALTSIRRAGADRVVSYYARQFARSRAR
ncbi:porphobilinogen synthase [Longimicrobium terrae]|uniref:Delta-aminolevulinic acid dehydratase n=1 Tax=Longimicrobium terrae TaxID=1639882 RepID=A0A841GV89_9BACT|nr:porphobilinogen synthase [Longimicrobium terrae]MBB4634485.1 porphobilinogen synthase [Longimicrobium terrae]MBB6068625.1 porphobilinogen synthase [Longimicrobium terrae]NNC27811.1 porphobilinogen synthase [Longimicrobium terrae]